MKRAVDRWQSAGAVGTKKRPRERLFYQGERALTDAELFAVLLPTPRSDRSSLSLAADLLEETRGLAGMIGSSQTSRHLSSLSRTQAANLLACLELARRLAKVCVPYRDPMTNPGAVARYLALEYSAPGQEIMGALYLDSRNRLIDSREIYRGTLNRAAVEPRAVLKEGLLQDAAGFVLFHTHPSGDPSPSVEDVAYTRRLAQSGELVGVRLVDHLILGAGDRWISLRQRGGW